jgi:SAM-dependent methyltransferase
MAVGGFDGMGRRQLDWLISEGLDPEDTLLEIGCGIFRAGKHFIEYLDRKKYIGMEISEETIQVGLDRLNNQMIQTKKPTIYNNSNLQLGEIGTHVDFIIAHSVFSHTPEEVIRECFKNLHKIMNKDSNFYFTFFDDGVNFGLFEPGGFKYSRDKINKIGEKNDLNVTFPENSYCQEQRQTLAKVVIER